MKNVLLRITSVCTLLVMSILLVSCAHTCDFSSEWTKDENFHWHICTADEECTEISDKAEHSWNEGEITTKATQEADGVKTYTCTVCAQTKEETVIFTGMSETEWNAAFAADSFKNFTYAEVATSEAPGMNVTGEALMKFTEDNAYQQSKIAGVVNEMYASTKDEAVSVKNTFINSLAAMINYSDYNYDAETKTYKANKEIYIQSLNASTANVTMKFTDGKVSEIEFSANVVVSGIEMTATSTISFFDYGTTVLPSNTQNRI